MYLAYLSFHFGWNLNREKHLTYLRRNTKKGQFNTRKQNKSQISFLKNVLFYIVILYSKLINIIWQYRTKCIFLNKKFLLKRIFVLMYWSLLSLSLLYQKPCFNDHILSCSIFLTKKTLLYSEFVSIHKKYIILFNINICRYVYITQQ